MTRLVPVRPHAFGTSPAHPRALYGYPRALHGHPALHGNDFLSTFLNNAQRELSKLTMNDLVEVVKPYYIEQVRRYRGDLRGAGQAAGKLVLYHAARNVGIPVPAPVSDPQDAWIGELVEPVLTPVLDGLEAEVTPALQKIGVIGATLALTFGAVAFFLGRWSAK